MFLPEQVPWWQSRKKFLERFSRFTKVANVHGMRNTLVVSIPGLNSVHVLQIVEEHPARAEAKLKTVQCNGFDSRGMKCMRRTRDPDGSCPFHKDTKKRKAVDLGFELADHT